MYIDSTIPSLYSISYACQVATTTVFLLSLPQNKMEGTDKLKPTPNCIFSFSLLFSFDAFGFQGMLCLRARCRNGQTTSKVAQLVFASSDCVMFVAQLLTRRRKFDVASHVIGIMRWTQSLSAFTLYLVSCILGWQTRYFVFADG